MVPEPRNRDIAGAKYVAQVWRSGRAGAGGCMDSDAIEFGLTAEGVRHAADERDVMALLSALESPTFEVRLAAVTALGEVGGDKARLVLLQIARDRYGERPEMRIEALRSLAGVFGASEYSGLLEVFIYGENRKVVSATRKMLADADPEGYAARLAARGALDHAAMRTYGDAREASAVPLLREFLSDRVSQGDLASTECWGKVYAAVKALGSIGGGTATEALQPVLVALDAASSDGATDGFLRGERLAKIEKAARNAAARAGSEDGPAGGQAG